MKTDAELDTIAQAIRDSCQLIDPDYPRTRRKLLRSIEIAALRDAREIVEKAVAYYRSGIDNAVADDYVRAVALEKLDKQIMALELK